ncbi:DoxX family protein [Leadbetterella sp. DM7]|uniref:DoxX family protein n=1 Tax=Leadbetterella sp. DM7 TaxID=3235085 RepID=UPI00349E5EF7
MLKKLRSATPISLDLGLLILRFFSFGFMLTHGWPKFQKMVVGNFEFSDPVGLGSGLSLGLAVFAEFFCSILIILGLFTRTALIFNAVTMLVAAFVVHASDPFKIKEMSLIYLVISVALILTGPGKYALDKK